MLPNRSSAPFPLVSVHSGHFSGKLCAKTTPQKRRRPAGERDGLHHRGRSKPNLPSLARRMKPPSGVQRIEQGPVGHICVSARAQPEEGASIFASASSEERDVRVEGWSGNLNHTSGSMHLACMQRAAFRCVVDASSSSPFLSSNPPKRAEQDSPVPIPFLPGCPTAPSVVLILSISPPVPFPRHVDSGHPPPLLWLECAALPDS